MSSLDKKPDEGVAGLRLSDEYLGLRRRHGGAKAFQIMWARSAASPMVRKVREQMRKSGRRIITDGHGNIITILRG